MYVGVVGAKARIRDVCTIFKLKTILVAEHAKGAQVPLHTAKLSHTPCAIFDSVLAEQGATRTMSAQRRSSMCSIGSPIL
jgi:hypothetical protein